MDRPFVSLTTDFGAAYTSICAGVVYRIAPDTNLLVLSDEIPKYAVLRGATLLREALPYLPVGVHVGVVDPGVGTARRPVALVTDRGDVLVGPDNGLLLPGAGALGGVVAAYLLENPEYRLPRVSATFHGRDIFSPAAAHLACGVPPDAFGPAVDPASLVDMPLPEPEVSPGRLRLTVLYADDFGNLVLSGEPDALAAALGDAAGELRVAWTGADGREGSMTVRYRDTFGAAPPGEPLLYRDSSGWLAIAVNQGSAAERLGIADGATVTVTHLG